MPATSPRPPRADARHDRDRPLDLLMAGLRHRAATPEAPAAPSARDAFPASREGGR